MDVLCLEAFTNTDQWGKDKAPNADGTSGVGLGYSPQTAGATPGGFPGTPSAFFPQYGGMPQQQAPQSAGGNFAGQQGGYGGPPAQSPGQYPNQQQMGYGAPASAGGYARGGQQSQNAQWSAPATQNFQNGFGGYQG
jgi:nucleolysin TIA-1/TIAR